MRKFIVSIVAILSLELMLGGCTSADKPRTIRVIGNQSQANLVVLDTDEGRKLLINGRLKAVVDTTDWSSHSKYVAVMDLPMHFFITPGKALLIGLCGGSVVKNYTRMKWTIDVVEPESVMITTAYRSFGLEPNDAKIDNTDGRQFLARNQGSYDIILVDAVCLYSTPTHLLTKEFFDLIKTRLNESGIVGVAMESFGWDDIAVKSLCATLSQCFQYVIVLPITEPPNRFGSIVIIASNTKRDDFVRDPERNYDLSPFWRYGPEYQKVHAWDNRFVVDTRGVKVQRDGDNIWEEFFERITDPDRKDSTDYIP